MTGRRDYATTFAAEAVVIVSYLLAFRIVANHLGPIAFGEYALSRRVLSFLAPLAVLGVDIAVTRLVAYSSATEGQAARSYPLTALAIVGGSLLSITSVLVVFRDKAAALLFGSETYVTLIAVLPVILLGTGVHGIAYGYLRGRFQIGRANLLMALNYGVVPVVSVLLWDSVSGILLTMGISWTAISLATILASRPRLERFREGAAELLHFGLPRVPGNLLQLGLFSIPGIMVAHVSGIRAAGVVAFGVATLGLVGSALTPIGFVLLPTATRLVAQESFQRLREEVWKLAQITVPVLAVVVLVLELFTERITEVYLGVDYLSSVLVIRLMILGVLPWGIFTILRSVLDARYVRAINTRNIAIACGCFLCAALLSGLAGLSTTGLVIAFVVSLYVLAALTAIDVMLAMRLDVTSAAQGSLET